MAGLVGVTPEHIDEIDPLLKLRAVWPAGLPIIRPMYHTPILLRNPEGVTWKNARFGIARSFSSFNARSENFASSRMWRSLFGKSHAVAPLSYIVEWKQEEGERVPYLISRKDGRLLKTPALIAPCFDDKADLGFAIATREPNAFFANFHDRMVGVLTPELEERWLDPASSTLPKLLECVRAPDDSELIARRAKGEVGKKKADDPTPIETVGKPLTMADFGEGVGKAVRSRRGFSE
jgi:putative SOS response-associated peptidase YedK